MKRLLPELALSGHRNSGLSFDPRGSRFAIAPQVSGPISIFGVGNASAKTEARLAAIGGFGHDRAALAQILEMGKGRETGGAGQGRAQTHIDLGDERGDRLRALFKRIQD